MGFAHMGPKVKHIKTKFYICSLRAYTKNVLTEFLYKSKQT